MSYVDGFVLPVPTARLDAYRAMAEQAATVWREHGALEYVECVADDVQPGEQTSFPQSVKARPDETVIFAWARYESREHRDRVNAAVMNDPRMRHLDPKDFPFDGMRMFWGGFTVLLETHGSARGHGGAGSDISGTDISGTDISGTDISGTDISGTDISGADAS